MIEVKNGFHPEAILEQLFKSTPLEESFGINAVALVDGQPRTLGLKEMLEVFLEHRFEVVRRRSTFRRGKAADRLHLVEGLLTAILDIDEVIQLIRSSDNAEQARERLISVFDLTEIQANYILDMPLRRLTRFSKLELDKEADELRRTIEELDEILGDDARLREVVSDELAEVAKTYGTPRRTVLLESSGQTATSSATPLEVADDPCYVFLSSSGLLARTTTPRPARRRRRSHPPRRDRLRGGHHRPRRGRRGHLGRPRGQARRPRPADPAHARPTTRTCRAAPRSGSSSPSTGERVLGLTGFDPGSPGLALGTRQGVVKRVNPEYLSDRDDWDVISLKDGDEVVGAVELRTGEETLCFVTSDAQLLHFGAGSVRPQGRSGGGIAGIKLTGGRPRGLVHRARPRRRRCSSRSPAPPRRCPAPRPGR